MYHKFTPLGSGIKPRRKHYPKHRRPIDPTTLSWSKQRSLQVDLMLDWADRVARLNKQGRVL